MDEEGFLGRCQRAPLWHPTRGEEEEEVSVLGEIIRQGVCKTALFVTARGAATEGALIT